MRDLKKKESKKRGKMFKVDDLKEVFELAATADTFINELMKIKSNCKNTNKDNAKIKSSGNAAQLALWGRKILLTHLKTA